MLVDTSGWLSVYHLHETNHYEAVSIFNSASSIVTHSYILAEFIPLAQVRGFPRESNLHFAAQIMDDPTLQFVWVDETLHRRAFQLLLDRKDKKYSLCDSVSFILMSDLSITEALTTDKHFEQEGFTRLLRP